MVLSLLHWSLFTTFYNTATWVSLCPFYRGKRTEVCRSNKWSPNYISFPVIPGEVEVLQHEVMLKVNRAHTYTENQTRGLPGTKAWASFCTRHTALPVAPVRQDMHESDGSGQDGIAKEHCD